MSVNTMILEPFARNGAGGEFFTTRPLDNFRQTDTLI